MNNDQRTISIYQHYRAKVTLGRHLTFSRRRTIFKTKNHILLCM